MIKKLDMHCEETVKEVLALQTISYQIEAEIINNYEIPPLKDNIKTLMNCDEKFYGYLIGDAIAGIMSYKIIEKVLDIHRLAIHPEYFRRGIAGKLIEFSETIDESVEKVVVCTGKKNKPAVNLYLLSGFVMIEDISVKEGLVLTRFEKKL